MKNVIQRNPDADNTAGAQPTCQKTEDVSQAPPQELTYGQRTVRVSFNPSGDDAVANCKQAYANIIDNLNALRMASSDAEGKRLASVAITEAQQACMWAVSAITWK